MTILEAMAAKIPVIATSVGATPQVIKDHVNGILIEPGNADILASAITDLVANPQKCEQLAAQAYIDIKQKFSADHMADAYADIYCEVLGLKKTC